jgi:glycosyltransferase involved in cell wall biosynthesis
MARRPCGGDVKVLHVSYSAPPDPPGGTEIYVAALCRALGAHGVRSVVAAPGPTDAAATIDGVEIRRFAHAASPTLEELYGSGDRVAADAFTRLLEAECPDIVHQHALTPACSVEVARRVKARGLPLVFTYHTPTVSCVRGTLLRWGRDVCDGDLATSPCAPCLLHAHGLSTAVAHTVSTVGPVLGRAVEALGAQGGAWTALRLPALVQSQHAAVAALFGLADAVVALSPWVRRLLTSNGVPAERIVDSAHGIAPSGGRAPAPPPAGPVRLLHLGRLDAAKGTRLVIEAMARRPDAAIALDVIGVVQGPAGERALAELERSAGSDERIRMLPAIAYDTVIETIGRYDAVVVPSQWLETGPLVVLEAFAAGVPVIGSDLGGIAEKVRHNVDGLLVQPFWDCEAWADALARCGRESETLRRLRAEVRPPRDVADVAREMSALYHRLVAGDHEVVARA